MFGVDKVKRQALFNAHVVVVVVLGGGQETANAPCSIYIYVFFVY